MTFKIESETNLHVKVVSFLKKRFPTSTFTATLGENQDTINKGTESHKKGYLRRSPDLITNNLHKYYTGLAIEFKTLGGGGGNFLMSGIRVCATDQGRFFTAKNPEQAPNFEVLLQNRPYFLKFYSRTGSFFDNLVSNTRLKCQNPSCFQLLLPAA